MIRPIGIPFIYFWYYEKKIIVKWSEDELLISNGEARLGMILIFNGGMQDYTWAKYNQTNTIQNDYDNKKVD